MPAEHTQLNTPFPETLLKLWEKPEGLLEEGEGGLFFFVRNK